MAKTTKSRTIQAVGITLEIIDYLHEHDSARITEIANELGRAKGTIHCHLATLLEKEHVIKSGDEYQLSLRYLELGEGVKDRLGFYDVVTDELDELAEESGELVQFATEEHGRAVYLYKTGGDRAVQTASSIGKREYLHCLALGKAILAHTPRERVEEIIDRHGLKRYTPQTITDREELFDELEAVRERGYAFDEEEKIEGLHCVAAPVMAGEDEVLGAVSLSRPLSRMTGDQFKEEIPNMVTRSANVIEINAKYS
ncbi:transcriptional regulator, IclR family (plasmid) [Haloterrigena turkmenica DSM 5511]|uniref:Transcriptional regulator, IclR family n=1 Tax=Haloterrigena turkmenica (strain ATCC 51198 / DSM 5511 / JCM 9101 / NCIMB 13204 / VKM B-1734 / 4k) TaxID=543526 RepID=D2S1F6_HALTV|nr:IclR family transcriptional regulator [Haloterrigena turkmenica]ADB63203.1 transcriptional regulator, IclR family [Haloterrigena turkmenica DSM 5511]